MAVVGIQPFIHVEDSNGVPIVGAKLHVYEVNTTTYRAIYSDPDLATPLPNPLSGANASDASGNFPVFYMAAGEYKLRAVTSADVLIWQKDDLDTGLSAGSGALPIASGGTGGTTAAAARTNLDVPSNSELADLAADIADLSSSVQNIVSVPQGRLTTSTATPVIYFSVSAGTAVYYTPFIGNQIPIYDGAQFVSRTFSELTLTLNSNHVANAIYDCFVYWDGSDPQIATGVAWNTATAGSGARGSGAGTTELTRLNGLWVNKYDIAYRNGTDTGTITANQGTYVGSIYMDGTNGQISCHYSTYGQSRKFAIWNAYNRKKIYLKAGDGTSSWAYSTATFRASRNDTTNSLTIFAGLQEEPFLLRYSACATLAAASGQPGMVVGIGYNSTTTASGFTGTSHFSATSNTVILTASAFYNAVPALGINVITALEKGTGTTTTTWAGTEAFNVLTAEWDG